MFLTKLDLNLKSPKTTNWLRNPYNVHRRLWMAFPDLKDKNNKKDSPFLYRFDLNQRKDTVESRILVLSEMRPNWENAFTDHPALLNPPQMKEDINPNLFIKVGSIFRFSLIANPTKKIINYRTLFEEELKEYPKEYSPSNHKLYLEGKQKLMELVSTLPSDKREAFRLEMKKKQLKNMKKVGIYEAEEQIEWLKRQGANSRSPDRGGGFELLQTEVKNEKGDLGYWNSVFSHRQEFSRFQITQKKDRESGKTHTIKIHTVTFSGFLRITDKEKFKIAYAKGIGSGKAFGCGMLLLARP